MKRQVRGPAGTRYVAHGTAYKPRDGDASLRFKRVRYSDLPHDARALGAPSALGLG